MDFKYDSQQQPPGMPPAGSYIIQMPFGQGPPPNQQIDEYQKYLSKAQFDQLHNAKVRQAYANARITESELLLRGLEEIRASLNDKSLTVGDGDQGSTTRPPLVPAFDEVNRMKLQQCYLAMAERYVNFVDNFLVVELKAKLTHEIKKEDGVQ